MIEGQWDREVDVLVAAAVRVDLRACVTQLVLRRGHRLRVGAVL